MRVADLSEVHDRGRYFAGPRILALGARVPSFPVPVHDRLQDGRERCDADARGYHHGVLSPEYVAGRRAVRADQIDLKIKINDNRLSFDTHTQNTCFDV